MSHAEILDWHLPLSRGGPVLTEALGTSLCLVTTPGEHLPLGTSLALRPTRGRQGHLVSWLPRGQLLPAPCSSSRNARIMEAWG